MSPDVTLTNATLSGPGTPVTFDFNPATIVISHSVTTHPSARKGKEKSATSAGGGGSTGQGNADGSTGQSNYVAGDVNTMIAASGITTIAVRQVMFIGHEVKEKCERLHSWTVLAPPTNTSGPDKSTQSDELPTLTFKWGSQQYPVTLNQLTISYTRFTSEGDPVRAVVDMTFNLASKQSYLTPTNPTSGGLPGRRSHVLTGAETLAGLSTQTYGSPGRWRQIATANGIQDPLRVPPGTLLYLPSAEENGR
jgi:nucleoid-associated protein YgaU